MMCFTNIFNNFSVLNVKMNVYLKRVHELVLNKINLYSASPRYSALNEQMCIVQYFIQPCLQEISPHIGGVWSLKYCFLHPVCNMYVYVLNSETYLQIVRVRTDVQF
jgi:hypothetical protein